MVTEPMFGRPNRGKPTRTRLADRPDGLRINAKKASIAIRKRGRMRTGVGGLVGPHFQLRCSPRSCSTTAWRDAAARRGASRERLIVATSAALVDEWRALAARDHHIAHNKPRRAAWVFDFYGFGLCGRRPRLVGADTGHKALCPVSQPRAPGHTIG